VGWLYITFFSFTVSVILNYLLNLPICEVHCTPVAIDHYLADCCVPRYGVLTIKENSSQGGV
jgi:hypothetical protein